MRARAALVVASAAPEGWRIVNVKRAGPGWAMRTGAKRESEYVRAAPIGPRSDGTKTSSRRRARPRSTRGESAPSAGRITTGRSGCQTVTLTARCRLPIRPAPGRAPPAVLFGAALALLLFAQAFLRLRRRGPDLAPWSRALLFAAGLALLVLPLVSPLDHLGDEDLLSAHMLQHVLIGDAAPALLLVAVRGPLLFFLLPPVAAAAARRASARCGRCSRCC